MFAKGLEERRCRCRFFLFCSFRFLPFRRFRFFVAAGYWSRFGSRAALLSLKRLCCRFCRFSLFLFERFREATAWGVALPEALVCLRMTCPCLYALSLILKQRG